MEQILGLSCEKRVWGQRSCAQGWGGGDALVPGHSVWLTVWDSCYPSASPPAPPPPQSAHWLALTPWSRASEAMWNPKTGKNGVVMRGSSSLREQGSRRLLEVALNMPWWGSILFGSPGPQLVSLALYLLSEMMLQGPSGLRTPCVPLPILTHGQVEWEDG